MNTTTTQFLRSDPAMYTSPGRTYARVGVRDPARMYVRRHIYFLAPWPLYVRVHATCAPLLRHVPFLTRPRFIATACRQTDRPVCTYTFATRMTTLRTVRPGGSRLSGTSLRAKMYLVGPNSQVANHFFACNMDTLLCVRRCSWWVPAVRGETFFFL